jgi:hypothetical protein
MKNILFLVLSLVIFTTACKKRAPQTNCWAVSYTDSVYSNIPALSQHLTHGGGGNKICGFTSDMISVYCKNKTYNDTVYNHGDTLQVNIQITTADIY